LALDPREDKPLPRQVEEEVMRLVRMDSPGFRINDVFQVQELARANRISRNTVTPAVKRLEQVGVLEFTHKNGYRVLRREPTISVPVRDERPLSMAEWARRNGCGVEDAYPFPAERRLVSELSDEEIKKAVTEALGELEVFVLRRFRFLIRHTDASKRVPMYEEAYVRADALPSLGDDFNRQRDGNASDFSLFGYYRAHLKTKIRASYYSLLADTLPEEVQEKWKRTTKGYLPGCRGLFTRLDSVNFCGPASVPPLERGGCLQYGREYYPSPFFRFRSANRQVDLTFG